MIAFASIWFAITRQRWKDPKYWSRSRWRRRCVSALILPFFLPYMQMQEVDRVRAIVERPVFRQPRRLADLVGVGASLVGGISERAQRGACSRASWPSSSGWWGATF